MMPFTQDAPPLSAEHKRKISLAKRGENHHMNKLTARQVRQIRARYAMGDRVVVLAKEYGIARNYVYQILNRKTWSHID